MCQPSIRYARPLVSRNPSELYQNGIHETKAKKDNKCDLENIVMDSGFCYESKFLLLLLTYDCYVGAFFNASKNR